MGARRRNIAQSIDPEEDMAEASLITSSTSEALVTQVSANHTELDSDDCNSSNNGSDHKDDLEEEEEHLMAEDKDLTSSTMEAVTEGELWYQLEKELQKHDDSQVEAQEEEAAAIQEITEEVTVLAGAVERQQSMSSLDIEEDRHFYLPGRIMHMVCVRFTDSSNSGDDMVEERLGIYETPRSLYSKIRLTKTMINDHYMPMYKRVMEQLISELENDGMLMCNNASLED